MLGEGTLAAWAQSVQSVLAESSRGGLLPRHAVEGAEVENPVDVGLLRDAGVNAVLQQLLVGSGERIHGESDVLQGSVDDLGRKGAAGSRLQGRVDGRGFVRCRG